jgi:hypothetical protein
MSFDADIQQSFQAAGFSISGVATELQTAGQIEKVDLKTKILTGRVGHYLCYRPPKGKGLKQFRLKGRLGGDREEISGRLRVTAAAKHLFGLRQSLEPVLS